MIDIKKSVRPRGRPRSFDIDAALDTAQALFHAQGYDAVGVAALVDALHINPPSFYAAFGSKAGLFDQVMARYAAAGLPLNELLRPGRDPGEALTALLEAAAQFYSADPKAAGCLVIEAARMSSDCECREMARRHRAKARTAIRDFLVASSIAGAEVIADFVDTTLSGLSASAREGWDQPRLLAAARIAAAAVSAAIKG